ncbi:MAG: NAD(P)/FAD-dependent oxidoreductase [Hyphomicrobiaceae bacterium]|nr:NAD(P)/FAD-dependent oxidoreductase [Hyphomicrobiaceae bacterium]MCC0010369.1 NAD(P)/FAD-dependent oxidoreductase [Hyphomicrobiaceae bacterium]
MAHIVVLGAGVGGMSAAYEARDLMGKNHTVTLLSNLPYFQFTPSNPWVGVGWRVKKDITIELAPLMAKHGIKFNSVGAKQLKPEENAIELNDGSTVNYDYLIISTGPELAFDEIPGLGPDHHTQSVCTVEHATHANQKWEEFCKDPGPIIVGAVQGASCYGPAYEYAMIMETDLRKRKLRDQVPMTFVTSEPYIGHLGLGGVGDTKGMLESEMRDRHIRWIVNAKVDRVDAGMMHVTEHNEDGSEKQKHEIPFKYSMMLPAFRGVPATRGHEGLTNPRGFIIVDKYQRNSKYPNIFGVGVCIAIAPLEKTPVAVGVPKTGYMIESMVTAAVENIHDLMHGKEPHVIPTWSALCLADFGDKGAAFVAQPQIPPRNINWSAEGMWVHYAKIAFEKYFIRKMRKGNTEPFYEKYVLGMMNIKKLKAPAE